MLSALSPFLEFVRRQWIFIGILIFALSVSLYQLTDIPPTWYDEGMVVQLSLNALRHGVMGTQVAPDAFVSGAYTSSGFPIVFPVAGSFALFGVSLFSARIVMVVYILLLLCASYFFIKRFAGTTQALFAVALLASFSSLYGNGKNVLGEVPGLFFLVLFLITAHAFFEHGKVNKKYAALAGLFFGLCIVTKPTFLVLGGAVFIALIYSFFSRDRSLFPFSSIPWGIGAALVPLVLWAVTQFNSSDDFSRIFTFYANPYQLTDVGGVMLKNALRFFTETTPLYLLGMIVVWMSALGIKVAKKEKLSFAEVTSLSFVILIILAYLRTPGWYRYLFAAQVVSTLFFPSAFLYLSSQFPVRRFQKFLTRVAPVVLMLLVVFQIYVLFFASWLSGYSGSSRNRVLQEYFGAWDPAVSVLIYDNPQVPLFLPKEVQYYQYVEVNADGYWGIGQEALEALDKKIPDAIVVSPDYKEKRTFLGYKEKETVAGLVILGRD